MSKNYQHPLLSMQGKHTFKKNCVCKFLSICLRPGFFSIREGGYYLEVAKLFNTIAICSNRDKSKHKCMTKEAIL